MSEPGAMPAPHGEHDDIGQGVTTLELFFDLVFVFTLTQLTALIEHDVSLETGVRTVLIFTVLFWMYGGFVWLTNQVPPVSASTRLLIIAGMAGLLVCALAVPHAFDRDGVAFGIGYLAVILVHGGLFAHAYGRAVLTFVPFNVAGALALLAAGVVGGTAAYALWIVPLALQYLSTRITRDDEGILASRFELRTGHFVERHGLLLLVAFGESVVAIGIGLAEVDLDARMYAAAVLGLVLVTTLWWTYFAGDDERAIEALGGAPREHHMRLALNAFFFAFVPMLLGIVIIAAGVALTIADIDVRAATEPATLLGVGAALYVGGDVLFRRALSVGSILYRAASVPVLLGTIAIGVAVSGFAQLATVIATLVAVLLLEERERRTEDSRAG